MKPSQVITCLVLISTIYLLTFTNSVFAQIAPTEPTGYVEATIGWTPPVTREDGSGLAENEISHFEISVTPPFADEYTLTIERDTADSPLPMQYIHGQVYPISTEPLLVDYRIRTVDVYGRSSRWSEPATYKAVVAPGSAPNAPTGLSLGVTCKDCTLIERK